MAGLTSYSLHSALLSLALGIFTHTAGASNSTGCGLGKSVEVGQTTNVTIDGRWYLLYFPVNYEPTTAAPLILSYHGGTRNATQQKNLDLLTTTYFNQDYVVVYPNGISGTWEGVPGVETDDLGFTSDILDDVESEYCIDTDRVYATGKSQGGGFVGVLACDEDLSARIAAFAPVSGAFYIANTSGNTCDPETIPYNPDIPSGDQCGPSRTDIPMLEFHGLADDTIAYEGGVRRDACLPTIPHWIRTWAERDGLASTNTSSSVPGVSSTSSAVRYQFGEGDSLGLVTHIMDGTDIGHDWPSTQPNSDSVSNNDPPASFNASSIIIDFFASYSLAETSSSASSSSADATPSTSASTRNAPFTKRLKGRTRSFLRSQSRAQGRS